MGLGLGKGLGNRWVQWERVGVGVGIREMVSVREWVRVRVRRIENRRPKNDLQWS